MGQEVSGSLAIGPGGSDGSCCDLGGVGRLSRRFGEIVRPSHCAGRVQEALSEVQEGLVAPL